jgi:hypothetical protein
VHGVWVNGARIVAPNGETQFRPSGEKLPGQLLRRFAA